MTAKYSAEPAGDNLSPGTAIVASVDEALNSAKLLNAAFNKEARLSSMTWSN